MTIDEWDEQVAKPMRANGAYNFPSRAELEALSRQVLADGWTPEKAGVFYSAFAFGAKAGTDAMRDVVIAADRPAATRYILRQQKNDITNLWGLIP